MEDTNRLPGAACIPTNSAAVPGVSQGIPPAFGLDGGHFYKHYDRLAKNLDEDLVESIRETLDGLLVFSGLFAGVNSAFLAISLSMMSPDPTETTQDLVRELIRISANSTLTPTADLQPAAFSPTSDAILVNQLFTGSLTCSLVAAFFAVLGKQWIAYYKKRGGGGVEKQRWEQLKRSMAAERWHLLGVLDTVVPVLLQIALLIFAVGLIVYLRTLSADLAYVTVTLVAVTVAAFLFTVAVSLWDPYCPFQTPASRTMMVLSPFASSLLAAVAHAATSVVRLWSRRRVTYSYWKTRLDAVIEAFRRPEDELVVVQAEAVCRVLETSEDHEALRHASHNIPALDSPEALYVILKNKVVRQRLRQLFEDAECQQTTVTKGRSSRKASPNPQDTEYVPDPSIYASAILHVVVRSGCLLDFGRTIQSHTALPKEDVFDESAVRVLLDLPLYTRRLALAQVSGTPSHPTVIPLSLTSCIISLICSHPFPLDSRILSYIRDTLQSIAEETAADCHNTPSEALGTLGIGILALQELPVGAPGTMLSFHQRWNRRNAAFNTIQRLARGTSTDIRNTLRELMPAALQAYWSPHQSLSLPCSTFLNFVKTIPVLLIKIPTEENLPAFLKLLSSLEELLIVVQLQLDTGDDSSEGYKQSLQLRDEALNALGTIPTIWMDGAILASLARYLNSMVCKSKGNTLACEDHQRVLKYLERFLLEPGSVCSALLRSRAAEYKDAYDASRCQHNNLEEECGD
ncbi:hypothetical protein FRC04_010165 [Tulasnella sp. 424]|nr:hypothetical protein FRC04_010165 [Tulasnella sp. 424]KAG8972571.1 hypothetical protein FRC05_009804 [Tulasnella sp. 425]